MAKVDLEALEAAKRASVGQLLLKCARLLDERALARVARVEGAGHWPHEENPAAVLAAMRGLLQRVGAAAG